VSHPQAPAAGTADLGAGCTSCPVGERGQRKCRTRHAGGARAAVAGPRYPLWLPQASRRLLVSGSPPPPLETQPLPALRHLHNPRRHRLHSSAGRCPRSSQVRAQPCRAVNKKRTERNKTTPTRVHTGMSSGTPLRDETTGRPRAAAQSGPERRQPSPPREGATVSPPTRAAARCNYVKQARAVGAGTRNRGERGGRRDAATTRLTCLPPSGGEMISYRQPRLPPVPWPHRTKLPARWTAARP